VSVPIAESKRQAERLAYSFVALTSGSVFARNRIQGIQKMEIKKELDQNCAGKVDR
jgi:hypothetical protein